MYINELKNPQAQANMIISTQEKTIPKHNHICGKCLELTQALLFNSKKQLVECKTIGMMH